MRRHAGASSTISVAARRLLVVAGHRVGRGQGSEEGAAHRSAFAKSDEAQARVRDDPDLAEAWARDRSVTTAETAVRRRRRLNGELANIGEDRLLSDTFAAADRGKAVTRALRPG